MAKFNKFNIVISLIFFVWGIAASIYRVVSANSVAYIMYCGFCIIWAIFQFVLVIKNKGTKLEKTLWCIYIVLSIICMINTMLVLAGLLLKRFADILTLIIFIALIIVTSFSSNAHLDIEDIYVATNMLLFFAPFHNLLMFIKAIFDLKESKKKKRKIKTKTKKNKQLEDLKAEDNKDDIENEKS